MLDELAVANLGVIASARLEPGPGLTVITGETGAGKTLLLGALRLLTGAAAAGDQIGPAGEEARVEGRIVGGDAEVVVARRLTRKGRSRAYLDGEMATNRVLADRVGSMVEIVGQHDQLLLTRPGPVRAMLDASLDDAGWAVRRAYDEAWRVYSDARATHAALGDSRALARELDLTRFQAEEIGAAGFALGDDEALRIAVGRLRNAEGLTEDLSAALAGIEEAAGEGLGRSVAALRRAARMDPGAEDLAIRAAELAGAASELAGDIGRQAEDIEHDPAALAKVEGRLAVLGGLKRKYGDSLSQVLDFGAAAATRAAELEGLIEQATSIDSQLAAAEAAVTAAGGELREARRHAAKRLAGRAVEELRALAFADPVVEFAVEEAPAGPEGADRVTLRFASDSSLAAGPVSRIASGGELSRVVLALRLAGGAGDAPIIAFDEIDTGVGGTTALAVGAKLAALAERRQVLCVTHLPQVAAFAGTHAVIEKTGRTASVRVVAGDERLEELARMLSGLPESERGREHAGELLALAAGAP